MRSKILIGTALTLCVAACASNPATPPPATAAKSPPGWCVTSTGTRIPLGPRECAAEGHTWTQKDISTTGATDAGQALRQLDPSLTITGH